MTKREYEQFKALIHDNDKSIDLEEKMLENSKKTTNKRIRNNIDKIERR